MHLRSGQHFLVAFCSTALLSALSTSEPDMPRFIVERTFPDGLEIPMTSDGAATCRAVVGVNAEAGVNWVQSFVSKDKRQTYCIYDAPTPDAIRAVARKNNLPVDKVTEIGVLDPFFYF
jgi:hypothetical protein